MKMPKMRILRRRQQLPIPTRIAPGPEPILPQVSIHRFKAQLIRTFMTGVEKTWVQQKAEEYCQRNWARLMRPAGVLSVEHELGSVLSSIFLACIRCDSRSLLPCQSSDFAVKRFSESVPITRPVTTLMVIGA
jgi:hypothetical protein